MVSFQIALNPLQPESPSLISNHSPQNSVRQGGPPQGMEVEVTDVFRVEVKILGPLAMRVWVLSGENESTVGLG